MEYYQILIQISGYFLVFAIGAMIEYLNLKHDQIIYKKIEKLATEMKNSNVMLNLLVAVITLLSFAFFKDYFVSNNDLVYLALTALLVYVTYLLVFETYKMRKAQNQPNVYVAAQPVDELNYIMEFFIQNIGLEPAYNVEFIDKPLFQYEKGKFLSDLHLIKNNINFLAPKQKMQIFMMASSQVFHLNSEDPINIKIKYTDNDKNKFLREYKIDFKAVVNVQRMRGPTAFESILSKNSSEINKSLSDISLNLETIANKSISNEELIKLINVIGLINSYEIEPLNVKENTNKQFEIAKNMVKRVLIEFLNDWKSYSKSNEIWSNEDAQYIDFVAINNRLYYHLFQFTFVSDEIEALGVLPDSVSNKLTDFAAKMRVIESKSDIVSSDAWGREYQSSIPNLFDKLLDDIKDMHKNLDGICNTV